MVFISGASSGIGMACAKLLAAQGCKLILTARRLERLNELSAQIQAQTLNLKLDVRNRKQVNEAIESLSTEWQQIEVLINNAGLSRGLDKLQEGSVEAWEEIIDTNVKGLLYLSRAIIPLMIKRQSGHVVNLGSIAGHQVYPGGNVYCASKSAVKALSEAIRIDLLGSNIRVTSIDPGMVETEFSQVRFYGDKERAKKVYDGLQALSPDDVADAILWSISRPAHVNISQMLIMPLAQATATLVHRQTNNL